MYTCSMASCLPAMKPNAVRFEIAIISLSTIRLQKSEKTLKKMKSHIKDMKKRVENSTPSLKRRTTTSLVVKDFVFRKSLPFIGVLNGVPDFEDEL